MMTVRTYEKRMSALHRFPMAFDAYDYRIVCLFFACVVYALFGSPTPDRVTYFEFLIGALLCLGVGAGRARDVLVSAWRGNHMPVRFWKSAGHVFLLYGLMVPLAVGVLAGNSFSVMIRDLIPFIFLFMPLLFLPLIRARPHYFRSVVFAILLIGMMFSFRSLVMRFVDQCDFWCGDELLYLENMPTVLFTALFLIGSAMSIVMRGINVKSVSVFFFLIVLSCVPLVAMILTLQRASLGAVALYIVMLMVFFIVKRPVRAVSVFVLLCIVFMALGVSLSSIYFPLFEKSSQVGLNMRPQEFAAVWDVITVDPFTFFFGLGWGGEFHSPAVGGLRVNFTHNFFSTILLKCGLLGIIFCIAYIAGLLERLSRVILANKVFGFALAAPVLIDFTLYASFKSLDFGLMLLLISSSLVYFRQSKSKLVSV